MGSGEEQTTVEQALATIASWGATQLTERDAALADVEREMETVQATLRELEQQLQELQATQEALHARDEGVDLQVIERSYLAIFEALAAQKGEMRQRSARVAEAESARLEATLASLPRSDTAQLYEEYRQFKLSVEPVLATLPESYRTVVTAHHAQVAQKVREAVGRLLEGPVALDVEPLTVELVFGVDAPEGSADLLIAVLPVDTVVHSRGTQRPEDLQTWLAARVVQALYETVNQTGPVGAEPLFGGHRGLLALEVELVGAVGDVEQAFQARLEAVLSNAPELIAAGLSVQIRVVPVDYLLPPEDESVKEGAHA